MAEIRFDNEWISCWKNDSAENYHGSNLYAGGGSDYHSLVGFDTSGVLDAMNRSSTTPSVTLHIYNDDVGPFDLGVHKTASKKTTDGIPWYQYSGFSATPGSVGYYSYDITSEVNSYFSDHEGLVFYQSPTDNFAYYSQCYLEVHGSWGMMDINVSGTWKSGQTWINVSGAWKKATAVWINDGGVWKQSK